MAFVSFVLIGGYVLTRGHPHEDAYILFIYAESLIGGHGISYFPGGPPTEGATDFLWMVGIALLGITGLSAGWAACLLNAFGLAVSSVCAQLLIWNRDRLLASTLASLLFTAILILSPIATAAAGGFSTGFYTGFVALAFVLFLRAGPRMLCWLPYVGLLLGLVRPDGVIIGVAYALLGLWRVRHSAMGKRYLLHAMIAAALGVVYFVGRAWYFGELLPLPLYVKSGTGTLLAGAGQLVAWARGQMLPAVAALAALVFVIGTRRRLLLAYIPLAALLVALAFAHQSQNIAHRFEAPATLGLLLGAALLVGHCLAASRRVAYGALAAIFVAAVLVGDDYQDQLENGIDYLVEPDYINYFPYYLDRIVSADTKIALTEAGRVGYWVKGEKLDLVGLNSAAVARERINLAQLEAFSPDLIFIHAAGMYAHHFDRPVDYRQVHASELKRNVSHAIRGDLQSLKNGVFRAPLVVLEFLQRHAAAYRVVQVRYGSSLQHVYAVRRDGPVAWVEFMAILEQSHDPAYVHSYQWFHDHPNAALRQRLGNASER